MKTILLFAFCLLPLIVAQDNPKQEYLILSEKLVQTALEEEIGYHLLGDLCKIGHRLVGSENSLKAVRWACAELKKLGADRITLQEVIVPHWERGNVEEAEIVECKELEGRKLNICALGQSLGTSTSGIVAGVLEVSSLEELKEKAKEAKGKWIFFNRPMDRASLHTFPSYGRAVDQRFRGALLAEQVSGVGALVRSITTYHDNVPHTGVMDEKAQVPGVSLGLQDADFLSKALKKYPNLKIRMVLSCHRLPPCISYNILADITGSEKPEEIGIGPKFDQSQ